MCTLSVDTEIYTSYNKFSVLNMRIVFKYSMDKRGKTCMAIPKYSDFYKPVVKLLADGNIYSTKEIRSFCIKEMQLSQEDVKETFANGNFILPNRIGWALTYLKKAALIAQPGRSQYQLTEEGIRVAKEDLAQLDTNYLGRYDSFLSFVEKSRNEIREEERLDRMENAESPLEVINSSFNEINKALMEDLMQQVMKMDPYEFEGLVMRVLEKMGYGTENENIVTSRSNDEGIDGIVTEDQFGFDKIYIQAKQWSADHPVGRPEVQKFLGAIAGKGGLKGLFITTSDFTSGAKDFVKKQLNQKIILINGSKLMQYMIKHNVGVSVESVYEIKRIDYDFFSGE